MVVLVVTDYFRRRMVMRFSHEYLGWRYFHDAITVTFTILVIWHAIDLGHHTNVTMSAYFILLAVAGMGLLAKLYWQTPTHAPMDCSPSLNLERSFVQPLRC